jgi:hypothetical protein
LDANQDHVSPIANFSLDQAKTLPIGAYTGNGNNKIMIGVLKATFIQFEMNPRSTKSDDLVERGTNERKNQKII